MKTYAGWKFSLLLLLLLIGLLPSCGFEPNQKHNQDDAMLLMISSYTVLLDGSDAGSLGLRGGGRMLSLSPQVTATSASEVDTLINIYSDLYNANVEKVYELYPDRADQLIDRLQEQHQKKVDDLLGQRERLRASRRRRRWGLFRRIGRGLGRIARFIGRTVRTIIIEEARSLAENAIAEIKQRVRDVFEGRVNTIIAKVASKFGPLAPFVQDKMKRVLDRWWIRLRDRISGRLAAQQRATQTAEARRAVNSIPTSDQSPIEPTMSIAEFEEALGMNGQDCSGDSSWIDSYWNDTVMPALKEDRKNCANTAPYYNCLFEKATQGLCAADAHEACESVYESLWELPDGSVTLGKANIFNDPLWKSMDFSMQFDGSGGQVNGSHNHVRIFDKDDPPCTTTYTTTFSGNFDPSTCLLTGSGEWTLSLSDTAEGGACWYHGCDFGNEGCTKPYDWGLMLEDGGFECVADLSAGEICNLRITMKGGG